MVAVLLQTTALVTVDGQAIIALNVSIIIHVSDTVRHTAAECSAMYRCKEVLSVYNHSCAGIHNIMFASFGIKYVHHNNI